MGLAKKLLEVMVECGHVSKDGRNNYQNYAYVTAARVNDLVNASLTKNGIVTATNFELLELREVSTKEGKAERLATVKAEITLHDVDSEETLTISGIGSGQDVGDKGVAKAQTMAVKYAWKSTLLIDDASDDPDSDGGFVRTEKPGGAPVKPATANNGRSGDGTTIAGKCEDCGRDVSAKNAEYSRKYHGGKLLCYNCQQKRRGSDVPF